MRRVALVSVVALLSWLFAASPSYASSNFDNLIVPTSSLTLGGSDHIATWYTDLQNYSASNPADTALAAAVSALGQARAQGSGWSLFLCQQAICGGTGYAQVVVFPQTAHYSFFTDPGGYAGFGVPATGATLIAFTYPTGGTTISTACTQCAAAAGGHANISDGQTYFSFLYYPSNPTDLPYTVEVHAPIDYPVGYAGVRLNPDPSLLKINTAVSDYEPWTDPTNQPFVRLTATITNASGAPAAGASVHFSNSSPGSNFTVPSNGVVSTVVDISKGHPDITINAVLNSASAITTAHVFASTVMTQCHTPGVARQTDALSSLLDSLIIATPTKLSRIVSNSLDILGKGISAFPDKETTVATATKFTGTFKTIYGLDSQVVLNSDGSVVKQYPQAYSRNYALVSPLFTGDGTPIQTYGRSLVCGLPA